MRLLFPSMFMYWAPLVLVPIILYLFRPRPRTVKTSTLPFFKWLAREHQDAAWLKWLKYLLSLLLSILVVLAGAAALGRLVVSPAADQIKTVVMLVDRSASMAATSKDGRSRLDEAITALNERVAGLPASVGVVVIAYDQRPEVLLARSVDRRQVERALASVDVRPVAGDAGAAMAQARQLAALETPAAIWHATDRPADEATPHETSEESSDDSATKAPDKDAPEEDSSTEDDAADSAAEKATLKASDETNSGQDKDQPEQQVTVESLDFALPKPVNVGITAVEIRRLPLERASLEAFVQIQGSAPDDTTVTLDVLLDGVEIDLRDVTLKAGEKETLLVKIKADQQSDRVATFRLSVKDDQLATDNVVYARIPKLRPIKVLWVSEAPDPYTQLALASLGADNDIEVFQGPASAWPPKEPVDVAIFDGWLPEPWPDDISALVVNPPGSSGPIQAVRLKGNGLPMSELRATREGHPLLYGVATGRVEVNQTTVLQADGPLQPVWVGSQGPVMLAGQSQGQRIAVFGFSPDTSTELPLMASYPLLVGNAIYWAAESQLQAARGLNRRTGQLMQVEGKKVTWRVPDGENSSERTVEVDGNSFELDQIGLWETDAGQAGSAALLSDKETLLHAAAETTDEPKTALQSAGFFRGDLAPTLLWFVVFVLLIESWLYHRCITN